MKFPAHMAFRRVFFSSSVKEYKSESLVSILDSYYEKNLIPSTTPSHKTSSSLFELVTPVLLAIGSKPIWQKNPSLVSFLHYATPVHVSTLSSLNLNPNFKDTVSCYASFLHVLTSRGISCHLPKIILSMTNMCGSVVDSLFVAGFSRKFKSQLTPKCYNALLDLLARFELVDEMKRVYADMLEEGMVSSLGTFTPNLMISAYCKLGFVVESRQYLCKMIQAGLAPDHFTFTSLILGHCRRHHDVDAAFQVFKEMAGHRCAQGYERLILEICEIGNLEVAERVLDQMLKEGIPPREMVFNALVSCFCKLQKYGEAVKVVEDMIRCGHSPPFECCKMLVCRLYERGDKKRAESVIQKLLRSGFYDDELACENWLDLGKSDSILRLQSVDDDVT